MKKSTILKIVVIFLILINAPGAMADPAGPGDGSDPFAVPVNGGVAFVAIIAFLYGVYRLYRLVGKGAFREIE